MCSCWELVLVCVSRLEARHQEQNRLLVGRVGDRHAALRVKLEVIG
jgi:hypothetical protein